MVEIEGIYKEESNQNVEAYLSALGVPWIARKAAGLISPTIGKYMELQLKSERSRFPSIPTVPKHVSLVVDKASFLVRYKANWRGLVFKLQN